MMKRLLIGTGVVLAVCSSSLFAISITVNGQSNIFQAGLGAEGTAVGGQNGLFPNSVAITPGALISFDSITGTVRYGVGGGDPDVGPDGLSPNPFPGLGTSISSSTTVSGITYTGRVMFLVGVFLTDVVPGVQPGSVSFVGNSGGNDPVDRSDWQAQPGNNAWFAIGQSFVIGDGTTGNAGAGCSSGVTCNATQFWRAPSNATRLFLGFADGGGNNPFEGAFGAYGDNSGNLTVNITQGLAAVPEPGTIMLMGLGLAALGLFRKKIS